MNQPREQGQRNEEQSKMELISGFEPRAIEISEDKLSLKFENVLNKKKKLVIIQAPINVSHINYRFHMRYNNWNILKKFLKL